MAALARYDCPLQKVIHGGFKDLFILAPMTESSCHQNEGAEDISRRVRCWRTKHLTDIQ